MELKTALETASVDDARARRNSAVAARDAAASALLQIEAELANAEAGLQGGCKRALAADICFDFVSEVKAAEGSARSGVVKVRQAMPCFTTEILL
jgi:hypothetical protein